MAKEARESIPLRKILNKLGLWDVYRKHSKVIEKIYKIENPHRECFHQCPFEEDDECAFGGKTKFCMDLEAEEYGQEPCIVMLCHCVCYT